MHGENNFQDEKFSFIVNHISFQQIYRAQNMWKKSFYFLFAFNMMSVMGLKIRNGNSASYC